MSKPRKLDLELLKNSIRDNRIGGGTDLKLQRYNYVIPEGTDNIYVGVWSKTIDWSTPKDWSITGKRRGTCSNFGAGPPAVEARMINFHPEQPTFGSSFSPSSPCWLEVSKKKKKDKDAKKVGILDAMTKHFMLVQENLTVGNFDLDVFKDWTSKKVAYAGEMFVLVLGDTCLVVINNGSGTYKPDAGDDGDSLRHLKAVAEHFSKQDPPIPVYAVAAPEMDFRVMENPKTLTCKPDENG